MGQLFAPRLISTLWKAGAATVACLGLVLVPVRAEAATIPEVGAHEPILTVEKNVNPQNKMVVYTKLDGKGRFLAEADAGTGPVLDFYWLMDGRRYKPVNPLIKSEIRKRFIGRWKAAERIDRFTVSVNDLKEVNCDIADLRMEICARETAEGIKVEAQMNLGPSDGNLRIRLSSIYTEGQSFPPAVNAVTLKGEELVNGQPTGRRISRRYEGANRPK